MLASLLLACGETAPPCTADVAVWEDLDGDGFGGVALDKVCKGDVEDAMVEVSGDCDDTNEQLSPVAVETCDGVDNDCDGRVDDDANLEQWWFDGDGDSFGGLYRSTLSCAKPGPEWVSNGEDCDDTVPAVNPAAQEVCGLVDEDCDGYIDEADDSVDPDTFSTFYADQDGDGFGARDDTVDRCRLIPGYVLVGNDCNDRDARITQAEYFTDADGDGYGDPATLVLGCANPPPGSVDNDLDCDDTDDTLLYESDWFEDPDGDGYGSGPSLDFSCFAPDPYAAMDGGDCDEQDPLENPGAIEDCEDGIDNNCDLKVDDDDPTCLPPCADFVLLTSDSGSTVGEANDLAPTCNYTNAGDVLYVFTAPSSKSWTFSTLGSNYDTMLGIYDGCGGPQIACDDDFYGVGGPSRVEVYLNEGEQVIVDVDGYGTNTGAYDIAVF